MSPLASDILKALEKEENRLTLFGKEEGKLAVLRELIRKFNSSEQYLAQFDENGIGFTKRKSLTRPSGILKNHEVTKGSNHGS